MSRQGSDKQKVNLNVGGGGEPRAFVERQVSKDEATANSLLLLTPSAITSKQHKQTNVFCSFFFSVLLNNHL